jgi:hypothetical protein
MFTTNDITHDDIIYFYGPICTKIFLYIGNVRNPSRCVLANNIIFKH